jgi:hypothetical protein
MSDLRNDTPSLDEQVTERHWAFAESLPVEGYLAYLSARAEGKSHIYAVSIANKACQRTKGCC